MFTKIIDFFKMIFGIDKDKLFYDDEEYEKVKKYRIIFFSVLAFLIVFLVLLIFTLCTMYLSTNSGIVEEKPPIENPEF